MPLENLHEDEINQLLKRGIRRIYLSHEPWDKDHAEKVARKFERHGIKVTIAGDVRRGWWQPVDEEDARNVDQAIANTDAVVFLPPKNW